MSRRLFIWLLFCLVTGAIFLTYAFASWTVGRGEFVLPLDDVYIHFQYARQLANGQPYIYNPGQPPTSGATSFIYPYILAAGYLLGFQGLNLSLWAMIVGALALLGSLWLVYELLKAHDSPDWLAVMTALIFGLSGPVSWHFMSGMETGLMILFTLTTLYGVVTLRLHRVIISAALLALTRPEGGVLAVIAVALFIVGRTGALREIPHSIRKNPFLVVPVLAVFIQPLVNLLVTGSAVATGNSVKSIFGTVPFFWDVVIGRILENFARMWAEFTTGVSPREGLYIPYLVGPLALMFLIGGLFSRKYRLINALLILWLLAGTASIATLDTAFWHFKRYQMPLIALLFPLAGWAILEIYQGRIRIFVRYLTPRPPLHRMERGSRAERGGGEVSSPPSRIDVYVAHLLLGAGFILTLTTGAAFVHHFALNVNYVYLQPLQMARWLQANTPEDAVIAVHDVGMMRYMGGRTTLDMVGLTTPGAAAYWRNGPGSIAEFLIQERPDYIASYGKGHGYGLELIANTPIYGDPLAEFPVELDPNYNVALAANFQGIYQPEWDQIDDDSDEFSPNTIVINVANLDSEADVQYQWHNQDRVNGFPTDVQTLQTVGCPTCSPTPTGGMRRINGSESFKVAVQADKGLLIASIVQPANRGTLHIYVNEKFVDRTWIPEIPGYWIWLPTYVPAEYISTAQVDVRIEVTTPDGYYMPLMHFITQNELRDEPPPDLPLASYQDGAIELSSVSLKQNNNNLLLSFDWYNTGRAEGDYRFFVHIYGESNEPPIAQTDTYSGGGMTPPGNWLPGPNSDSIVVDLTDVSPGTYSLAIGFYNPYTGERLMPESELYEVSADGRLWLGEVEVPDAAE